MTPSTPASLPPIEGDFYHLGHQLTDSQRALQLKVRNFMEQEVKPIVNRYWLQNHLVEMLSNLTAMQTMVFRLSQLQDEDKLTDEHASLAKVFCTLRTRDIVGRAREVMGGNGILLQYNVARFVADAEAIYSYEGTKEINSLIVGRAITGFSAFV